MGLINSNTKNYIKKSLAKMFNIIFEFQGGNALPISAHVTYYIIKIFLAS